MPLSAGTRVGPYEILSALGAGGMGEVYRARDTRLERAVAIKLLPEAFAADTERVARFQREAKILASLNHPNIAQIHGIEESPLTSPGQPRVRALVMELVEGEDLAKRITRGAIPIDEALPIAKQMADALEAAHEQGVIHRDFKPANIMVGRNGTVKVLDFGLAKAMEPTGIASPGVSQSPTITASAMTEAAMILGTAAYMSPEQARGHPVDKRADIWAFGCVLYEMLSGRRAFVGQGVSETLARVIEREPDWTKLPGTLSPAVGTFMRRCVHKDPRQRVQAIGDVRLALEGAFDNAVPHTATPASAGWRRRVLVAMAAIIMTGTVVGSLVRLAMNPAAPRVSRLQVAPWGADALSINWNDRGLAITPDGERLVYVGNRGSQIFVRALDALAPVAVFTGYPSGLFVSPDGQWIGFVDGQKVLKKVSVTGGPAVTVATLDTAGPSGATWGPDGRIIVATNSVATGLQQVDAAGGSPSVLTQPDRAKGEADHFWPEMLPGGRAVLFTVTSLTGGVEASQVAVLDLQTGRRKVLVRGGSHGHYVPSGHLVYLAAGALQAVRFDLTRQETHGIPIPVVADVETTVRGAALAVVADNGTLAYVSGSSSGTPRTLLWVDRQGREVPIPAPPRPYFLPGLSPDGTRFTVFANDQEHDLWLCDLARTTFTRLTSTPGVDVGQVWTPDSRRLIFTSERAGVRNVFWQAADGSDAAERLIESPNTQYPTAVSPDGGRVIITDLSPQTGADVTMLELDGTRGVTPLVRSPFAERNGIVSPNGRWLAYEANDSGRFEVYVRPFPDVNGGFWQVSTNGGTRPVWTRSGQELVYVSATGALMGVVVAPGPSWAAATPTLLVKEGYFTIPTWWGRSYDVSRDGHRFLMIKEGGADGIAAPASIVVGQNWIEELKRVVPTK